MPKVHVSRITVGELAVNCWFLVNEDSKEALVFDPGDQAEKIAGFASEQGVKVAAILLTHGHIDHMGGADALRKLTGAKVYALQEEEDLLLDAKQNLSVYIARKVVTFAPDEFLHDGQELTLAGMKLKVYHTPGHTPGGVLTTVQKQAAYFPEIPCSTDRWEERISQEEVCLRSFALCGKNCSCFLRRR